jgi:hypothetical protein
MPRFVLFALLVSFGAAFFDTPPTSAQCQLPEPVAALLQGLPNQLAGPLLYRTEGLTYLDRHCLDEARNAFQQELVEASTIAANQQTSESAVVNFLLDLTKAYVDWQNGNLDQARTIFTALSDDSKPMIVNTRAIFALAEMLMQSPDSLAWVKLEPKLKILDEQGHIWIARRYRLLYGLTTDNAPARITSVENILAGDLPVIERLEDEIILATLLRKAGRLAEARILTADIETDVGNKVISPDLRVAYVRECAAIASDEARHGDSEAAVRYQKYLFALGEMYAPH